jgi:hypothetical protein
VKLPTVLNEPPKRLRTDYRIGLSAWTDKSLLEEGHFYPYKTIDHGDGQPRPGQRSGDGDLVAAGRFQDDDGGSERPHAGDERDESRVVMVDAKGLAGGEHVDIEVGFRDIDTNEAGMFHDPSLHMRALSAHATVRVR